MVKFRIDEGFENLAIKGFIPKTDAELAVLAVSDPLGETTERANRDTWYAAKADRDTSQDPVKLRFDAVRERILAEIDAGYPDLDIEVSRSVTVDPRLIRDPVRTLPADALGASAAENALATGDELVALEKGADILLKSWRNGGAVKGGTGQVFLVDT